MNNHLIVLCNPKENSFSQSICDEIITTCNKKNIQCQVRDLYDLDFDPILTEDDLERLDSKDYSFDIAMEHSFIKWADIITFIYPIWWAGMPSLMKGYIDRIICKNFAYCYTPEGIKGLLTNKKIIIFNPFGNTLAHYQSTDMLKAFTRTIDEGIFQFCGAKVLAHEYFENIHRVDEEIRKNYLEKVNTTIQTLL
ncbi:NAD(P)H-dependent oxidoreductase [Vallitalea okinawensis]|uniref:NAD(P)H-dependent oxidoreductase n=1 Tax=Vallitalea okinawensis TaxID=2078660 RepID=UPI000CFDBDA5|nr:NAD(P)H-dependent oxidoreductase [Vallitalea okinawensis]